MPTIVPPSRARLGEVIAELEALGGKAKQDFRISRTRTGDAVLEVSDELYGTWDAEKTKPAPESTQDSGTGESGKSGKGAKSDAEDPAGTQESATPRKRR